jgi:hypothetical protein
MKLYRVLLGKDEQESFLNNKNLKTIHTTYFTGQRQLKDGTIISNSAYTFDKFFFTSLKDCLLFLFGEASIRVPVPDEMPPIIEIECDNNTAQQKTTLTNYTIINKQKIAKTPTEIHLGKLVIPFRNNTLIRQKYTKEMDLIEVILPQNYVDEIISKGNYRIIPPKEYQQFNFNEIFENLSNTQAKQDRNC